MAPGFSLFLWLPAIWYAGCTGFSFIYISLTSSPRQINQGILPIHNKPFTHFGNLKIIQLTFIFHVLIGFQIPSVGTSLSYQTHSKLLESRQIYVIFFFSHFFFYFSSIYNKKFAFHLHGSIYIFGNTSPPVIKEQLVLMAHANCFT